VSWRARLTARGSKCAYVALLFIDPAIDSGGSWLLTASLNGRGCASAFRPQCASSQLIPYCWRPGVWIWHGTCREESQATFVGVADATYGQDCRHESWEPSSSRVFALELPATSSLQSVCWCDIWTGLQKWCEHWFATLDQFVLYVIHPPEIQLVQWLISVGNLGYKELVLCCVWVDY
jgi:hypothetical protein